MYQRALLFSALLGAAQAQQIGTLTPEVHPPMTWQRCSEGGSCTTVNGKVVIDSNWRWVHNTEGYANCYTGNEWDSEFCPDNEACAARCALEGADYPGTYGATASGDSLRLNFVTESEGTNVGSRLYMMKDDDTYEMYKLLAQEFTFDVDTSKLPCGVNGALYFVSMEADGGKASYAGNAAGAAFGTGYCDSQCPRDLKFIGGLANVEGWGGSDSDPNGGVGNRGSCCAEMDIWEANSISNAYTPHPCDDVTPTICEGDSCGGTYSGDRYGGTCDPDGCDFNPYRQGNQTFYGPGGLVDSNSKLTVVTQFLTSDGTPNGELTEIKRFYVQDGQVIPNSESTIGGLTGNSITTDFCAQQKQVFGDEDIFTRHGGLKAMGEAIREGMVLVMSIWDDHHANMLWLDSSYPIDADPETPGIARGSCATDSGDPAEVEANSPDAYVVYSNIKVGPIGSTFGEGSGGNPNPDPTDPNVPAPGGQAGHWEQCGGNDYNGPTQCESPWTCQMLNEWYHQCL
ncbi:hypothetical protein AJ80_08560 [Polytolypa hystricis UAMH7299]|uniref:Glucanase n=1 Tax=Polytolypa hystricis (strain UAMH7299) TaxID=1447883 RepID=A0A2B7X5J3_POLH7|nr:hypothetical protein AJ80_08560 [Polytolypa hystricis UAMH7299]